MLQKSESLNNNVALLLFENYLGKNDPIENLHRKHLESLMIQIHQILLGASNPNYFFFHFTFSVVTWNLHVYGFLFSIDILWV